MLSTSNDANRCIKSAPYPVVALSETIEENLRVATRSGSWLDRCKPQPYSSNCSASSLFFENSVVKEFSQLRFPVHDEMRGEVGLPTLVTPLVSFNMADHNV